MRISILVSISSLFVFVLSFTAWIFLLNDYTKFNQEKLVVKGLRVEEKRYNQTNNGGKNIQLKNSILDESLSVLDIDDNQINLPKDNKAPIRKRQEKTKTYVGAKAVAVVDVASEQILHNQNMDKQLPIASLTKLMTALVVIDNIRNLQDEIVVIDKEVCNTDRSIIGCPSSTYCFSDVLQVGERVRAEDLLEAMLVNSANDAAVALAKHIAGSQDKFAELMNKKAREIGLKNTHFCNPSGLDDESSSEKCYSSAKDVAQIVVYALKNKKYDKLQKIFKIKEKWFQSVDGSKRHRFATTNILLETMPNCEGAKTGFTYEAGKTLMMIASHPQDKNIKVVGVLLDDVNRFEDMQKLFHWIFVNYTWE